MKNTHIIAGVTPVPCAIAVFLVLFVQAISANGQSQEISEYWINAQSTPVRIVVKRGSRPDRLDEFFENVSNGSVTSLKLGCVTNEQNGYEIVREEKEIEINLSPMFSTESKTLLPKGSHGGYLSICRVPAKVTIVAVKFEDGAKWTIR